MSAAVTSTPEFKRVLADLMEDVDRHEADGQMIMLTLVGSHAYGLATPTSDYDFLGVFVPSPREALVGRPKETLTSLRDGLDYTMHSTLKYIELAAKGNPTILESLWLEPLAESPLGKAIRDCRRDFVTQRALHQYRGYAAGQLSRLKRVVGAAHHDELIPLKQQKLARHMMRILEQGITLSNTSEVVAQVEDPEALFRFAARTVNEVAADFEDRFLDLKINTDFPEIADDSAARDAVFEYYLEEIRNAD